MKPSRVGERVSLEVARERLLAYMDKHGSGPHRASTLADVIWPDNSFLNPQGAGAAASRLLCSLGCDWTFGTSDGTSKFGWYGWMLDGLRRKP